MTERFRQILRKFRRLARNFSVNSTEMYRQFTDSFREVLFRVLTENVLKVPASLLPELFPLYNVYFFNSVVKMESRCVDVEVLTLADKFVAIKIFFY